MIMHYERVLQLCEFRAFTMLWKKACHDSVAQATELAAGEVTGRIFAFGPYYTCYSNGGVQLRAMVTDERSVRSRKVHWPVLPGWINPMMRDPAKRFAC